MLDISSNSPSVFEYTTWGIEIQLPDSPATWQSQMIYLSAILMTITAAAKSFFFLACLISMNYLLVSLYLPHLLHDVYRQ